MTSLQIREMKESGIEWIGEVPSNWKIVPQWSRLRISKELVGDSWDSTQLLSLTKRGVITRNIESGEGKYPESFEGYQFVEPGDLIFCLFDIDETPRTVGMSRIQGMITSAYTRMRVIGDTDSRFLEWYFLDIDNHKKLRPFYTGLRKVVTKERFLAMRMALPPLEEQVGIAEFLDRETAQIDALIEKQRLLVEVLKERRNAVILKSVTSGLNEDAEFQSLDSLWLSRVPMHWAVGSLKWFARLQTGGTPRGAEAEAEGPYPWLRPDDLNELGNPSSATRYIDQEGASQLNIAQSGATLICCIGGSLGKSGQIIEPAYFNQQITSVTWNMNRRYLYYLISGLKEAIRSLSVGNTLPILNNEKLGGLKIVVPPIDEQGLICEFIESKLQKIDGLIQAAIDTVDLLKERRQALISAAVTGKIDVWGN